MESVKVLVTQLCPTHCDPLDCVPHHAPLSMGFSRQEYWSGLPFPSPRDLPHPGIEPGSPTLQANSLPTEAPGSLFKSEDNCFRVLCRFLLHNEAKKLYVYTDLLPLEPPSSPCILPLWSSQSPELSALSHSSFPLALCFSRVSVFLAMLLSQLAPPSPSFPASTSPFSMPTSLFLPCK